MKVISVVGAKKTGKTTLVTSLVKSLLKFGRVGTIKNMAGHAVDSGDTMRHLDAGADVVIGLGKNRLEVTKSAGSLESALADLQTKGLDFVVVEGFKQSGLPKIVLGDIEVPQALGKVELSKLDDDLIGELTDLVLGLDDYCIEPWFVRRGL